MNHVIKKISLFAALAINFLLAACGGAAGVGGGATGDTVSINGTTYTANSSTLDVSGYVIQTSTYFSLYGGPTAIIGMNDTQSKNTLILQITSTVDGWPGVYTLLGVGKDTVAYITDKTVATGGVMQDLDNLSGGTGGTGGSITVDSFGALGQAIKGSFNMKLCDKNAVCANSIKTYIGTFNVNRKANIGSLASPVYMTTTAPANAYAYPNGINQSTGKNYYTIATNSTGGTLTLTVTPTVDVNMAVFMDAGFTTPATCNTPNTLNLPGMSVETCAITVTPNQKLYLTMSQPASAPVFETYTLKVAE